jgi:hypothetical protein
VVGSDLGTIHVVVSEGVGCAVMETVFGQIASDFCVKFVKPLALEI